MSVIQCQKQILANREFLSFFARFFFFCILASFISLNSLSGKKSFPARGFAKILTENEAVIRLGSYRSFIGRDLNNTNFHQAYAFRFRLRHMPRRGDEFSRTGTLYGFALGHGLSRIDLDSTETEPHSRNFLLQNGLTPRVWVYSSHSRKTRLLEKEELFNPLIFGMNQSPFDLLMPFVFWNAKYLKSGKVAGRPSHLYSFTSPQWVESIRPDLTTVVMALDDNYEAPLRIETFGQSNVAERTFILNSLKKVSDHWIVKSLDYKDRQTRSNTRFEVTAAALNLDLDPTLLTAAGLKSQPVVPNEAFVSTK